MNTNLKRAIAGLALLLSMGVASASTYYIGDLTSYGEDGYWNDVTLGVGSFSDEYTFSVPSLSDVGGGVANVYVRLKAKTWDIDDLTLTLMDGSTTVDPGTDGWTIAGGDYSFKVAGDAAGTQGGKYTFYALAAPVPEPSTWAMMLGGLGLIGFMSYRRRQYF